MLCLLMEGRHEVGSPVLQSRGSDKLCDDDESDDVAMDMLHSFLCCFLPLLSPQFPQLCRAQCTRSSGAPLLLSSSSAAVRTGV